MAGTSGLRQPGRGREGLTITGSVTLTNQDIGKTIISNAGGACTVTMPDPATCSPGDDIYILNIVGQNLLVTSTSKLVTFNNASASTVAYQTSSELIGGAFLLTCVGAKWHVAIFAEETQTVTVS